LDEKMSDRPGGEATEQPTEKKLKKAFEEGRVAYSTKVSGVIQLLALLIILTSLINITLNVLIKASRISFSQKINYKQGLLFLYDSVLDSFLVIGIVIFSSILISGFLQVGFRFNPHQMKPKLSRISMAKGFKKLFSKEKIIDLAGGLIALICVLLITVKFWNSNKRIILGLSGLNFHFALQKFLSLIISFLFQMVIVLGLFSIFDYFLVYFRYKKSILMTKYEVEKEQKQDEGDPRHKSERRRRHEELLFSDMISSIKEADVVIINPSHIAIAVKHGENCPKILAKGENLTAKRIKNEARKLGIPIYRDVKLARNLNQFEIGDSIPEDLYEVMAAVLLTIEKYG
jgi:flagellar biosynthesis protein FlhB